MASSYVFKRGDTGPTNTTELRDRDGNAVVLSGATVRFHMRTLDGATLKVDAPAEVVDAASGKVRYQRTAADVDTAGHFQAEYEVTFSDASVQSFPEADHIDVRIVEDLG